MLLVIDIGNTNISFGIFEKERLRATWRIATDVHKMADEYAVLVFSLLSHHGIEVGDIGDAIISSVVPPVTGIFEELCQRYFEVSPLVVGAGVKTGVRISMDNPREVGADRIANAAAAHRLYKGPVIVIDFGTAITVDAVSEDGDYLGGAVAPGIGIAAEALFERASKLPRVEMIRPKSAIGRNTVAAMQSGIIFGYIGLIEGLVSRIRQELEGTVQVVATGGHDDIIAMETPMIDLVNPNLTLEGLRLIHGMNRA